MDMNCQIMEKKCQVRKMNCQVMGRNSHYCGIFTKSNEGNQESSGN